MIRNSFLALVILMLVVTGVSAQDPQGGLILPVANGGFVIFTSRVSSSDVNQVISGAPVATLQSFAVPGQNHVIHRVLKDGAGKPVFGYDLWISSSQVAKEFRVMVKPIDPQFIAELRNSEASARVGRHFENIATVPAASEQKTLSDGDAFSFDLLVNPSIGIKIVDVVKVAFDRSRLEAGQGLPTRDVTVDLLELSVNSHQLLINGEVVGASKSKNITSGPLLWFYVQDRGRFIFSLVPRAGYEFQKIGVVEDNRIEFVFNGDRYEWLSSVPIVAVRGRWNLWVLSDQKYSPLFAAGPAIEENNSTWQKMDPRITLDRNKGVALSTQPNSSPKKRSEGSPRPRVMIGGADRMESLWPKGP